MKKGAGFSAENVIPSDIPATWAAMEKLFDAGKARAIGVSNFSSKKLADLLAISRVPPAVNQVECHPVWQQDKLRAFCESKGIHLSVRSVHRSGTELMNSCRRGPCWDRPSALVPINRRFFYRSTIGSITCNREHDRMN
jgi:aryl-alcohol dehydrogenase-like predicted oxidoreductase